MPYLLQPLAAVLTAVSAGGLGRPAGARSPGRKERLAAARVPIAPPGRAAAGRFQPSLEGGLDCLPRMLRKTVQEPSAVASGGGNGGAGTVAARDVREAGRGLDEGWAWAGRDRAGLPAGPRSRTAGALPRREGRPRDALSPNSATPPARPGVALGWLGSGWRAGFVFRAWGPAPGEAVGPVPGAGPGAQFLHLPGCEGGRRFCR